MKSCDVKAAKPVNVLLPLAADEPEELLDVGETVLMNESFQIPNPKSQIRNPLSHDV